jgi:hypothetical protein
MNLRRLLQAGLVTAAIDFMFSSVLVKFFYGSTVTHLWQSVASVPLGPEAMNGGLRTAAIGVAIHVCVAFLWSTVMFMLLTFAPAIGRIARARFGLLTVAAVYGPFIWLVMSFLVIPSMTHRPPTVNYRWWVQLFGHIPFVALPIVATLTRED